MSPAVRPWLRRLRPWLGLGLLVAIVLIVAAACVAAGTPVPSLAPGQTAAPTPTPTLAPAAIPLAPAVPDNPLSLIAFLFTPIFQALFISLVAVEQATGSMVLAIIAVTLLVRVILIPLYRKQIVSQKRMQLLSPELKEIQKRYKGDRVKLQEATQAFYKERGVNPAQGCLPLVLQFMLLIPMYSVFSSGLQNYNPNGMLRIFGIQIITLPCPAVPSYNAAGHVIPCINSTIHLFGYSIDLSQPSVIIHDRDRDQHPGDRLVPAPAVPVADDPAAQGPEYARRPEHQDSAPVDAVPAVHLDLLRWLPAGRPVHLLDRVHSLLTDPAVPDHWLGRDVPLARLGPGLRPSP